MNAQEIAQLLAFESGSGPSYWDQKPEDAPIQADQYGKASTLLTGLDKGYNESDDTDETRKRQMEMLRQAQRYDSTAAFKPGTMSVQMDRSKLPKWSGPDPRTTDFGKDQEGSKRNFDDIFSSLSENNAKDRLIDPSKVIHDENYGDYTLRNNLKQASNDHASGLFGMTEKYMPSIISAIMAAGMGVAAGPMMGGLLSSGIGPGGIGNKLAMGEKVDWKKAGINGAMGVAGGYLPGMLGQNGADFFSWLQKAKQAYGLYNQYQQGRG